MFSNAFGDEILSIKQNIRGRIRVLFDDNEFLDIRFPRSNAYSFHYQTLDKSFRIDTSPHHDNLNTSPHHFHDGEFLKDDEWTNPKNSVEVNIQGIIRWLKDEIRLNH